MTFYGDAETISKLAARRERVLLRCDLDDALYPRRRARTERTEYLLLGFYRIPARFRGESLAARGSLRDSMNEHCRSRLLCYDRGFDLFLSSLFKLAEFDARRLEIRFEGSLVFLGGRFGVSLELGWRIAGRKGDVLLGLLDLVMNECFFFW